MSVFVFVGLDSGGEDSFNNADEIHSPQEGKQKKLQWVER